MPRSRSACLTRLRSVSAVQPIFAAIEPIASPCEARSPACSSIIRTARSRTSGAYRTDDFRFSIAPSSQELEPPGNPAQFRARPWGIENSVHWVLDTPLDEDRARNRKDHSPENLAILRKLALNVLR